MADVGAQSDQGIQERTDWRRLLATLVIGGLITAICFILGWWWVATAFLLFTLFLACLAFGTRWRVLAFTVFAVFAIAWLTGSLLDQFLPTDGGSDPEWRMALAFLGGIVAGIGLPALFWFLVFWASTEWLMSISETHAISKGDALRFVVARTFGTAQALFVVENGKLTVEKPKGILSKLGGPGTLVVRSGTAVVLERGSRISRVLGPGTYALEPGENFKQPAETKGIIDLRGGGGVLEVENVLTKDGILLKFKIGGGFQLEPKSETDKRPSSRFEGGEATTPVVGAPEYPVYEATILKAVNNTGDGGLKDMYPKGAVDTLRDVVASYTFDQIFPPNPTAEDNPDPDSRLIKQIEKKVKDSIDASWRGVLFRGIDIQEISMPPEVREKWLQRWAAPADRELSIRAAEAQREIMIVESEGRARSIEQLDRVKLASSARMAQIVEELAKTLPAIKDEAVAYGFLRLVRDLAVRLGRDEESAITELEILREWQGGLSERRLPTGASSLGMHVAPPPALAAPQNEGDESGPQAEV
jgi:regulator of protease activity HflC (stomatin/prohibitin superfamily)